jgi:hypothetical protein
MTAPTRPDLSTLTVSEVRDQLIQIAYDVAAAYGKPPGLLAYQDVAARLGLSAATCVNVQNGTPACLIGQWLVRHAGVTPQEFADNSMLSSGTDETLRTFTNIPRNGNVGQFLSQVQANQDGGDTWLKAIQDAYKVHGRAN